MNSKVWKLNILLILVLLLNPFCSTTEALPNQQIVSKQKVTKKIKRKDLEKQLGRKLKLKERIALWIVNKKIKKSKEVKDNNNVATYALIASVAGVIPFIGIFFALAGIALGIISLLVSIKSKREAKYRKKALIAIRVGLLTAGWSLFLIWLAIKGSK